MRTVILIPRRPDNGRRDDLFAHTRLWWEQSHWPVYEGHHIDGPFNRAAAVNLAAREADRDARWDVAIVADADVLGTGQAIEQAVTLAARTNSVVLPHDRYVPLNEQYTNGVVSSGTYELKGWTRQVQTPPGIMTDSHVSSIVVVPRLVWDELGGFDTRFSGWGCEDRAFIFAAERLHGVRRIKGDVFHLWHPVSRADTTGSERFKQNKRLENRYASASSQAAMLALLNEPDRPTVVAVLPGPSVEQSALDWAQESSLFPPIDAPGFADGETIYNEGPYVSVRIQILTLRDDNGVLVGVFYHYPEGDGTGQVPPGAATVMVSPHRRREGFGSLIVVEGQQRFGVDATRQRYTVEGHALIRANAAVLGVTLDPSDPT